MRRGLERVENKGLSSAQPLYDAYQKAFEGLLRDLKAPPEAS
jgi:hypothetical protein